MTEKTGTPGRAFRAAGPNRKNASRVLKVLIVDDHQDSAELLATVLQLEGYETRVAHDGQSAIPCALEFRPDVVLLDIGLPVMDGYELARRLREHSSLAGSQLIAVTGYSGEEDRRRAIAAGFAHHLVKPVDPDQLRRLLDSLKDSPTGQE